MGFLTHSWSSRVTPLALVLAAACGMPVEDPGSVHGEVKGQSLHVRDAVALRLTGTDTNAELLLLSDRPWLCSRLRRGEQLKTETVLYLGPLIRVGEQALVVPDTLTPQLEPKTALFTRYDEACQPALGPEERKAREQDQYRLPPPSPLEGQALTGKFQFGFGQGDKTETLVGSYTARFCDVEPAVLANSVCP